MDTVWGALTASWAVGAFIWLISFSTLAVAWMRRRKRPAVKVLLLLAAIPLVALLWPIAFGASFSDGANRGVGMSRVWLTLVGWLGEAHGEVPRDMRGRPIRPDVVGPSELNPDPLINPSTPPRP